MAGRKLDDFMGQIKDINFSKPYLFEIRMSGLNSVTNINDASKTISILAKSSTMPNQTVNMINVPYQGRTLKFPGEKVFADWGVTIINDENYAIRTIFEDWMEKISANDTGIRNQSSTLNRLLLDIDVIQLDTSHADVVAFKLVGAFPTEISQLELSWENVTATQDLVVTFAYQYYVMGDGSSDGGPVAPTPTRESVASTLSFP